MSITMPRHTALLLQFLAYGFLVDFSYAIIGKYVRPVTATEFPFAVSISLRGGVDQYSHLCTGTLISINNVLTVAHCLLRKNVSDIQIVAGSRDWREGRIFYPESWITYDEWKLGRREDKPSLNDIAIIRLEGHGVFNQNPLIYTAKPFFQRRETMDNRAIRMAGWGRSLNGFMPPLLKSASATILSNEECNEKATALKGVNVTMPPNHFCSKADSWALLSKGDSGGPVKFARQHNEVFGINVVVMPPMEGSNHTQQYIRKHQLNSHLYLAPYSDFIERFTAS